MTAFLFSLNSYSDLALLFLRVAVGVIFLVHGSRKIKHARGWFLALGFAEVLGAIGLFTGLLVQPAALGLAIVMLGAIYHKIFVWHTPFLSETGTGFELDLIILAGCVVLIMLGGGAWGLDRVWFDL